MNPLAGSYTLKNRENVIPRGNKFNIFCGLTQTDGISQAINYFKEGLNEKVNGTARSLNKKLEIIDSFIVKISNDNDVNALHDSEGIINSRKEIVESLEQLKHDLNSSMLFSATMPNIQHHLLEEYGHVQGSERKPSLLQNDLLSEYRRAVGTPQYKRVVKNLLDNPTTNSSILEEISKNIDHDDLSIKKITEKITKHINTTNSVLRMLLTASSKLSDESTLFIVACIISNPKAELNTLNECYDFLIQSKEHLPHLEIGDKKGTRVIDLYAALCTHQNADQNLQQKILDKYSGDTILAPILQKPFEDDPQLQFIALEKIKQYLLRSGRRSPEEFGEVIRGYTSSPHKIVEFAKRNGIESPKSGGEYMRLFKESPNTVAKFMDNCEFAGDLKDVSEFLKLVYEWEVDDLVKFLNDVYPNSPSYSGAIVFHFLGITDDESLMENLEPLLDASIKLNFSDNKELLKMFVKAGLPNCLDETYQNLLEALSRS